MAGILMWILYLWVSTTQSEGSENPSSVKILVIGRTGSGKSTLINNILGRKIATVGHRPFPKTTKVSVYQEEIYGVNVTACDTPGLQDATGQEEDYLNKIKVSCGDADLVVFCLSMDNVRWHNDDEEAIKAVTEHLGKEIWEHSVLVLTFADKLVGNYPEDQQMEIFNERISDLKQKFQESLLKVGVLSDKIFSAVSAKGHKDLPGVSNWLTELMVTCLSQTQESGKEGFRQIILQRMKFPEELDENDYNKPEYEQPLIFTESLCSIMKL